MDKYPEDIMMYTSFFSLYLALIKIPKHESDAGNLIPLTAGNNAMDSNINNFLEIRKS